MLVDAYVAELREDGAALAACAASLGLDADVATTPGWRVADLLGHVGGIHRWATACLTAEPGGGRIPVPTPPAGLADGLLDWFREGHEELVSTLINAPEDLQVWTFMPAPSPKAFWARRQAHETAVHRADLEQAAGAPIGYPSEFAVDGIDELLNGFLAGPRSTLLADPPTSLLIAPTDANIQWRVTIKADGREVRTTDDGPSSGAPAAATVRASASDLYLFVWNRAPAGPVEWSGDTAVMQLWRDRATI